jgi:hypothetical protein
MLHPTVCCQFCNTGDANVSCQTLDMDPRILNDHLLQQKLLESSGLHSVALSQIDSTESSSSGQEPVYIRCILFHLF